MTQVSQKVLNREMYFKIAVQAFVILNGLGCLYVAIFWKIIQLSLMPDGLQKCDKPLSFLGQTADMRIVIFIAAFLLLVLGFGETVATIIRARRNGRKK